MFDLPALSLSTTVKPNCDRLRFALETHESKNTLSVRISVSRRRYMIMYMTRRGRCFEYLINAFSSDMNYIPSFFGDVCREVHICADVGTCICQPGEGLSTRSVLCESAIGDQFLQPLV